MACTREVIVKTRNSEGGNGALDEALEKAIYNKEPEIALMLINGGVNVNAINEYDSTALILAANYGLKEVVQALINAKANINAVNVHNKTALTIAVFEYHTDIAELLIEAGADVNIADNNGNTALIFAAKFGFLKLTKILLNAGANIDAANNHGHTAHHLAACRWQYSAIKILEVYMQRKAAVIMADSLRHDSSSFFFRAPRDIVNIISSNVAHLSESDPEFTNHPAVSPL